MPKLLKQTIEETNWKRFWKAMAPEICDYAAKGKTNFVIVNRPRRACKIFLYEILQSDGHCVWTIVILATYCFMQLG